METIEILPITELGMWQAESMEIKFMNDNDYSKLYTTANSCAVYDAREKGF